MRYLLFTLFLVISLLTAGCVGGNQNSNVTPIQPTTTLGANTPVIATPTTQISPTETVDTLCGELVYCGYAPSGFETQPIKSDRCTQLGNLRQQNDPKVMTCLKNPYEVSGNNAVVRLHCMQGIGTVEDCAKYGVRLDRDNGNVIP
jgi:hypothetical protein